MGAHPIPAHAAPESTSSLSLSLSLSHGKLTKTVGKALGHPHDCVRGSISTQAGTTQVLQMLLVRVTVAQPACSEAELGVELAVISEKMVLEMVETGVEEMVWEVAVTADPYGRL